MSVWISPPTLVFPPETGRARDTRFDFYMHNVALAYGRPLPDFADISEHIDTSHPEGETVAAAALRLAMLNATKGIRPEKIYDCRSSLNIGSPAPSYKLVSKAGMERVVPICLHGQFGIEVVQALLFGFLDHHNGTQLTAISALNWPIQWEFEDKMLSSSASASTLLHSKRPSNGGFKLLGVATARHPNDRMAAALSAIKKAMMQANISHQELEWAIVHNGPVGLTEIVATICPDLQIHKRKQFQNANFGCADLMVSLAELTPMLPTNTPGIMVGSGSSGMAGAVIISPDM